MPYQRIDDLPGRVKKVLPPHAQEIYMSAFNNAYQEYKESQKRDDPHEKLEPVCHKVAWAAVKSKYKKDANGNWSEKSGHTSIRIRH